MILISAPSGIPNQNQTKTVSDSAAKMAALGHIWPLSFHDPGQGEDRQ